MNRILLTSSLALSNAVIDSYEKGITKSEIFHAANVVDQLERGSRRIVLTPKAIIKKMVAAKVKDVSLIVASDLTRGQIAYCIAKHLQTKKTKKKGIAAKVTVKSRTVISTKSADIQKRIKFSAPLKVVTANVVSSC